MSRPAGWGAKPSAVSTIIAATSRFRRVKSWLRQRPFPAFVNVSPDNLPVIGECTYGCSKFGHEPDLDAGRQYQQQIATSVLKSNIDAERSSVLTILGSGSSPSLANVGAGIGGSLNIAASYPSLD